ncbi:LysM domain-containing protein [Tenacibaculum sp. MAR_2009_124]|uniref:PBP1 and LysM peptidoglycan-binding domain-containing protein n=1 Tax=Tenacibaculum sp. MAR_2009_124 TaxID=1250059 RepID=UPI00089D4B45|nr:LysM peptidoglycan-binding domain-containing protein [Tenacibaculum sp. MAR_2009_124]SEB70027.1 LysM domain-containing protein [Tenacibaculum sp. MAR_2009_124]
MKKLQFLILTGILTISISCGQQKRYVSYKVQDGETMNDIAERLNIDSKDLRRLNPDVGKTPSPNTVIVIPNPKIKNGNSSNTSDDNGYAVIQDKEETTTDAVDDTSEEKEKTVFQTTVISGYETHTVQAGETVYRITKQYGITKDKLIELNPDYPELKNNTLSIGQVLNVNTIEETVTLDKEEIKNKYLTHAVQSKETVYGITRFYNISKEDLVRLNPEYPEIKENQLSIGQLLKIKLKEDVEKGETLSFYRDSIQEESTINLTLLLPFRTEKYDTLSAKRIFKNGLANLVTDFYMGAKMAIDSLRNQGITINTRIFDTGTKGKNISSIIDNDELENQDVVIGPFYSKKATEVSKATNGVVIFPHYSNKQNSLTASKIVKSSPDKESYTNFLTTYLKNVYKGENIFIVSDDSKYSKGIANSISSSLKKHDSISKLNILKPEKGYIKRERFTGKMNEKQDNWVIIATEDNVTIKDALNSMIGLPDNMTVQVFTSNKNKVYDNIDNNKLANINFTYVSDSYADESSDEVQAFYNKFKENNNTLPSSYAVKGFDVTYDVLMRLASGNKLSETFKEGVSLRVENKFDYHKKTFGSPENKGLFIVKYNPDLSLKRLK